MSVSAALVSEETRAVKGVWEDMVMECLKERFPEQVQEVCDVLVARAREATATIARDDWNEKRKSVTADEWVRQFCRCLWLGATDNKRGDAGPRPFPPLDPASPMAPEFLEAIQMGPKQAVEEQERVRKEKAAVAQKKRDQQEQARGAGRGAAMPSGFGAAQSSTRPFAATTAGSNMLAVPKQSSPFATSGSSMFPLPEEPSQPTKGLGASRFASLEQPSQPTKGLGASRFASLRQPSQPAKGLGGSIWSHSTIEKGDEDLNARLKKEREKAEAGARKYGMSMEQYLNATRPVTEEFTETKTEGNANRLAVGTKYSTFGGLGSMGASEPDNKALLEEKDKRIAQLEEEARRRDFPPAPEPQGNVELDSELRLVKLPLKPGTVGTNCPQPDKSTQLVSRPQPPKQNRHDRPFVRQQFKMLPILPRDMDLVEKVFMDKLWDNCVLPRLRTAPDENRWEVKVLFHHAKFLDVGLVRLYNLIKPIRVHAWDREDGFLHVGVHVRRDLCRGWPPELVQNLMMESYGILLSWSEQVRQDPNPVALVDMVSDWYNARLNWLYEEKAEGLPENKAEGKPEVQAAEKPKDKPEVQAAEKSEKKAESKSEAKPETKPEGAGKPATDKKVGDEAKGTDKLTEAEVLAKIAEFEKVLANLSKVSLDCAEDGEKTAEETSAAGVDGGKEDSAASKEEAEKTPPAKLEGGKKSKKGKKGKKTAEEKTAEEKTAEEKTAEEKAAAEKAAEEKAAEKAAAEKAAEEKAAEKAAAEKAAEEKAAAEAAEKGLALQEIQKYADKALGQEKADHVRRNKMLEYVENWPSTSCLTKDEVVEVLRQRYISFGNVHRGSKSKKEENGAAAFVKAWEDRKKQLAKDKKKEQIREGNSLTAEFFKDPEV